MIANNIFTAALLPLLPRLRFCIHAQGSACFRELRFQNFKCIPVIWFSKVFVIILMPTALLFLQQAKPKALLITNKAATSTSVLAVPKLIQ